MSTKKKAKAKSAKKAKPESPHGDCAYCGTELMAGEADENGYCEDCHAEIEETEL